MNFRPLCAAVICCVASSVFTPVAQAKNNIYRHHHLTHGKKAHFWAGRAAHHHHLWRGSSLRKGSGSATPETQALVTSLIKAAAPGQGVPTWFALRIAQVESNYNPRARGLAGEYGIYQLKCQTARGVGFTGDCSRLLDPYVNVHYGLRHLALAVKLARGNLQLAASKHNGGLGTKRLRQHYVRAVF